MSGTTDSHPRGPSPKSRRRDRRGTILVMAAFMMIVMMALLALSVDLGYVTTVSTELKRATDAAALAGAGALIEGPDVAEVEAFMFLARNPVGGQLFAEQENWEELVEAWIADHPDEFKVQVGHWYPDNPKPQPGDEDDPRFVEGDYLPSTIRIRTIHNNAPLFFAKVFGQDNFSVSAESIARYQPRDIALVLDFSGSMNDDSELKRINWSGSNREVVEASLLDIYQDLGSPTHGNLQFEPECVTVVGEPPSAPNMPQITVEFRSMEVHVTSTKDLSNVVMEFHNGVHEKVEDLSSPTGTFRGSGSNYSKRIVKVWVKSGSNDSGDGPGYGELIEDDYDTIKQYLGLDSVSYPYSSGSWNNYINYVKTRYNVYRAGYRRMYGYKTLINYWLEKKPKYSQTCDLWMVRAQPVATVKDSVSVFMDYIQEVDCDDRVGLVVYNSPSQNALVEHNLTENFDDVEYTVQHRQAAHYDCYTNIGAGIHEGRLELDANARVGAKKMIVLMTDGIANRPSNSSTARAYALEQAQLAADSHYPIVTISLGNSADTSLMQQIADITDGVHFNVPGEGSITDYEEELLAVFRQIADDRPLVLVK